VWIIFFSANFSVSISFSLLMLVHGNGSVLPTLSSYTGNVMWPHFSIGIYFVISCSILSLLPLVKTWCMREISWIVVVTPNFESEFASASWTSLLIGNSTRTVGTCMLKRTTGSIFDV
jgi:hypothetical protein